MANEMAGAGVEVAFAIFRRLFPLGPWDPHEPPLTDEERKSFHRWEVAGLIPLFVFTAALTYPWYLALEAAAGLCHRPAPEARVLIRPDPGFWFAPALFLGIISSAIPLFGLYRLLLGRRYRRFDRACAERLGFDGRPVAILMVAAVVLGVTVAFDLLVGNEARFTDSGVAIDRPWPFRSRSYTYGQVRAIELRASFRAPIGNIVHRPHHVILFEDGTSWNNDDICRPTPEQIGRIVRLVSEKSGRAVVERP